TAGMETVACVRAGVGAATSGAPNPSDENGVSAGAVGGLSTDGTAPGCGAAAAAAAGAGRGAGASEVLRLPNTNGYSGPLDYFARLENRASNGDNRLLRARLVSERPVS